MGKLNRDKLLSHIKDTYDIFEMKKLIDKIELVIKNNLVISTDFFNPYEANLAISILDKISEVKYVLFGGYENSELKIITIFPQYLNYIDEYDINVFKFKSIENIIHKDILGSLIGLGINRRKIGDILIDENFTYFFVKKEISNFILSSFNKVSKYNISLEITYDISNLPVKKFVSKKYIVSSLRLDNFISKILNISRSKSLLLIQKEKVKVNYKVQKKSSYELNIGDIISIRKFGRFIFYEILGMTKRNNYIILVRKPK